ncbi:MAG: peptide chain release factor N(5)-glutamine methyltransferase [Clostridia bacterium]|nr:peptide chain release factor N(5)-glutamine methyltransferase [Clostridia bacterium]
MAQKMKDVLKYGRDFLNENGVDSREARLLLANTLQVEPAELIKITECTDGDFDRYVIDLRRRAAGEPFAYIAGRKEFMKLPFMVNKNVLIPREDTEILVLEAIKQGKTRILDLCTGSGCIAISLAKYLSNAEVDASDISSRALVVAKKNAVLNGVKVNFIQSDLFENIEKKYEMIVSNPPYIRKEELKYLQAEVKREPKRALDGGKSGLDFYEKIIAEANYYLKPHGTLLLEIGFDQAKEVTEILKECHYRKIKKVKDLSGNDRVIIAERG